MYLHIKDFNGEYLNIKMIMNDIKLSYKLKLFKKKFKQKTIQLLHLSFVFLCKIKNQHS